jgi:hypothetical protein
MSKKASLPNPVEALLLPGERLPTTSVRVSFETAEQLSSIREWLAAAMLRHSDVGVRKMALALSRERVLAIVLATFERDHVVLSAVSEKEGGK